MKLFFSLSLSFLLSAVAFSQRPEQLSRVIQETNHEELRKLKLEFNSLFAEREKRIENYLSVNPDVKRKTIDRYTVREIYDVTDEGDVLYFETSNAGSSVTSRANHLYNGGSLGLNIQGQDMIVRVWDSGRALDTHVEFPNNKVMNMEWDSYTDHATHVMGTIVAQGINSTLRGIAFDASGYAYNWLDDYSEMTTEASFGMLVSNHSYWIGTQPTLQEWTLGAYDSRASQFDQIAFNAPYYLAVTAAGNDRNSTSHPVVGPYLIQKWGYNLIRGMQNAKNYLTVGAVAQVSNYTGPESVLMSNFSSWGPTDDGRIKPDIVAKGVSVNSPISSSDTDSAPLPGTSMASPAVSGVALLMQQYHFQLFNNYMRAATLKGLLLHTADEAGYYDGPDYEYGWGLINAQKAAIILERKNNELAIIEENTLNNNQTYSTTVTTSGSESLMVSISWTDRAATANNGVEDPSTLYLVNDLDVRVFKDGVEYFPWTLDPAEPYNGAVNTADNFRDNYEKIEIKNPNGTYEIVVSHKGSLVGSSQNYSLIVSGPNMNLSVKDLEKEEFGIRIFPNPTQGTLNFETVSDMTLDKVEVYDTIGKRILTSQINNNSVDISQLTSGVYFVKIYSGESQVTKKIIKK